MDNYFRILELKIGCDYLIGFNSKISNEGKTSSPYTSVLIGQNGTRKSLILKTIIQIFREADFVKSNNDYKKFTEGNYHLTYFLKGEIFELYNHEEFELNKPNFSIPGSVSKIKAKKNEVPVEKWSEVELPATISASTIMLTDKFPVIRKIEGEQTEFKSYRYLGIRNDNSPLSAGTKQFVRKTVDFIVSSITKENFRGRLGNILEFLDFERQLNISYVPKYRNIFYSQNLTPEKFKKIFENWEATFPGRKSEPWGKWYFDKIKDRSIVIEGIVNFLNRIEFKKYGRGGRYFDFEILEDNSIAAVFPIIQHLSKLDLISYPELTLKKGKNDFTISDSSSGELQILSSFIGIMANIEPNSLVLIDEPEISLHPNWQMRFINILKSLFSDSYNSCHFIIASHSHFIISDLEKDSSAVLGLKINHENRNKVDSTFFDFNTFGWSAEQILLDVFNVASTRNYFITKTITEVLKEIAKEETSYDFVIKKLEQVVFLDISDFSIHDPIREVFNELKKLYKDLNDGRN